MQLQHRQRLLSCHLPQAHRAVPASTGQEAAAVGEAAGGDAGAVPCPAGGLRAGVLPLRAAQQLRQAPEPDAAIGACSGQQAAGLVQLHAVDGAVVQGMRRQLQAGKGDEQALWGSSWSQQPQRAW